MNTLLGQDKDCDAIHYALNALRIPHEIIYTGGGIYLVWVEINPETIAQMGNGGANLITRNGEYLATISNETKPIRLSKEIAHLYKINK
jgi:hypothetical protein